MDAYPIDYLRERGRTNMDAQILAMECIYFDADPLIHYSDISATTHLTIDSYINKFFASLHNISRSIDARVP